MSILKNKRIFVTGASGFFGNAVVKKLSELGAEVYCLNRKPGGYPAELGVKECYGDVRDEEAMLEFIARSELVIHLAGFVGNDLCNTNPHDAIENNVRATVNILQGMKTFRIPGLFASVANKNDHSIYAITKNTAERFCLMFNKEHKTQMGVLRFSNIYGPGQSLKSGKLIVNNIHKAIKGEELTVFGDGEQSLDFIFVDDAVNQLIQMAENIKDLDVSVPYYIGSGENLTVKYVVESIKELTQSNSKISFTTPRNGDVMRSIGKNENSDAVLKLSNSVNFKSGLKMVIKSQEVMNGK